MDTISHGLAGSVLSRALPRRPGARVALVVGAVAAMVPDLDFLFFSSRLQYLRDHRGWTHSFLVLPFLALAIALVAKLFARREPLRSLWLFAAVGLGSHIVFDWITSFGTMFWTPVSRTRYSLDWVFILDPIFTGLSLVSLVLAFALRGRGRGRRIARVGSSVLLAYVVLCGLLHAKALETWKRLDHPPLGARVAVLPQFLSPFRWMGLSSQDDVHVCFFDIGPFAQGVDDPRPPKTWKEVFSRLSDYYPPPARAKIQRYASATVSPPLAAARALPDWAVYLAFARFPLETVTTSPDGGWNVIVQDLRFLPWFVGPWERGGKAGVRRQPFVYRVRYDRALKLIDRGFIGAGR